MKEAVSKSRSRKTKSRVRNAEKASSRKATPAGTGSPAVGVLIGFLMWFSVMIFLLNTAYGFLWRPAVVSRLAGDGFLLIVALLGCGVALRLVADDLLRRNSELLLLLLVSLFSLFLIGVLMYFSEQQPAVPPHVAHAIVVFLLPISLSPLLATILIGGTAGMILGVWVSCAVAIRDNYNFDILIMGLVVTVVATYLGRNVRKRSTVFRIGLVIALVEILFVMSRTLVEHPGFVPALPLLQVAACLINGVFTSIVVLLTIPLFEALFKITTDITLLELSDLGSPLLQRLAIEAPGTYHHSLVVASLAQAAADEIGANSLLARVCAYFHDIGKLTKPDFFAENIQQSANPHDDLAPSMSTLVITTHVKEGVSLAVLNKLPPLVIDVIKEHHGTGLVHYFHHKAKQQLELELANRGGDPSSVINENDFRYPGPRPKSRESAIISLADPVEAASRSLEKSSPGHIEDLVDEVVNAKLLDHQLDACDLTMEEIGLVKRSFVFTLTNMLHARVAYPKDEDSDKQPANGMQTQHAENKEAHPSPDESRASHDPR